MNKSDIDSWRDIFFDEYLHEEFARIVAVAIEKGGEGITVAYISELIDKCFKDGFHTPVSILVPNILRFRKDEVTYTDVSGWINRSIEEGYNELTLNIAKSAVENNIKGISDEDIKSWMQVLADDSGNYNLYSKLGVAVIERREYDKATQEVTDMGIEGIDDTVICGWIKKCRDAGAVESEAYLRIAAFSRGVKSAGVEGEMIEISAEESKRSIVNSYGGSSPVVGSTRVVIPSDEEREAMERLIALSKYAIEEMGEVITADDIEGWINDTGCMQFMGVLYEVLVIAIQNHEKIESITEKRVVDWADSYLDYKLTITAATIYETAIDNGVISREEFNELYTHFIEDDQDFEDGCDLLQAGIRRAKDLGFDLIKVRSWIRKYKEMNTRSGYYYKETSLLAVAAIENIDGVTGDDVAVWAVHCFDAGKVEEGLNIISASFDKGIKLPDQVGTLQKEEVVTNWCKKCAEQGMYMEAIKFAISARAFGIDVSDEDVIQWQIQCLENRPAEEVAGNAIELIELYRKYPLSDVEPDTLLEIEKIVTDLSSDREGLSLETPMATVFPIVQEQVLRIPGFAA